MFFQVISKGITAGSTTSERAAYTVQLACIELVERLRPIKVALCSSKAAVRSAGNGTLTDSVTPIAVSWPEICAAAILKNVCTTVHMSHNFSGGYAAFSAASSEVELDVLTGEMVVLSSHIVYDCARSLNPTIDIGQVLCMCLVVFLNLSYERHISQALIILLNNPDCALFRLKEVSSMGLDVLLRKK